MFRVLIWASLVFHGIVGVYGNIHLHAFRILRPSQEHSHSLSNTHAHTEIMQPFLNALKIPSRTIKLLVFINGRRCTVWFSFHHLPSLFSIYCVSVSESWCECECFFACKSVRAMMLTQTYLCVMFVLMA